jgi:hypothetical protein
MTAYAGRGIAIGSDPAALGPILPSVAPDNETACRVMRSPRCHLLWPDASTRIHFPRASRSRSSMAGQVSSIGTLKPSLSV